MKEILVIYYSQSGQLFNILKNVMSTVSLNMAQITYYEIVPKTKFPFPWKESEFYDAFPETFLQIPVELEKDTANILSKKYDLIILGYTVWFLTPSIPINSFLKSKEAEILFQNTPVITISASRNMWIMAQEKIKKLLKINNALLVGNIALVDKNINHVSVITIAHWLMGGKKTRLFGVFPKPGISDRDIREASKFGIPISQAVEENDFSSLQKYLLQLGAVTIKSSLIATDIRGNKVFSKWASYLIKKAGNKRKKGLVFFKYYLLFAIWIIAPIVFIVFLLAYVPTYRKIKREKAYYSSVALK